MALTDAELAEVRWYMGASNLYLQTDTALTRALSAIASKPEAEAKVRAQLAELQRIDEAIRAAEQRFAAESVGSIRLNRGELQMLRSRGRQEVGRLAAYLGVPPIHDVYSAALPSHHATRYPGGDANYRRQG